MKKAKVQELPQAEGWGSAKGLDLLSPEVLTWGSCKWRRLETELGTNPHPTPTPARSLREADLVYEEGLSSKPFNNETGRS